VICDVRLPYWAEPRWSAVWRSVTLHEGFIMIENTPSYHLRRSSLHLPSDMKLCMWVSQNIYKKNNVFWFVWCKGFVLNFASYTNIFRQKPLSLYNWVMKYGIIYTHALKLFSTFPDSLIDKEQPRIKP
jgi:hypothetical protein